MSSTQIPGMFGQKPIRKRNRVSLSCLFCKKRKVKCDKGDPCSTCKKYNAECIYELQLQHQPTKLRKPDYEGVEERKDSDNSNVYDELKLLKEKLASLEDSFKSKKSPSTGSNEESCLVSDEILGYNPISSKEEYYSFFNKECPVIISNSKRKNFCPLTWVALIKTDTALVKLWRYIHILKRAQKHAVFAMDKNSNPDYYRRQVECTEGLTDDMKPYKAKNFQKSPNYNTSDAKNKINARAMSLGLMFYEGGIDEELALIDKIELVLPKQKVIWKLIERFFSHVYPYFPLLDEDDFRSKISQFIGPEAYNDAKINNLKIERKIDFTYLGTLLLVLRFAYLTLFTNSASINEANLSTDDPSPKAQDIKYLLSNVISIDVVDVAEMCLNQFNLVKTLTLPLLQLAIYTRVYRIYSPEDGEGRDNTDSVVYTGTLHQMAFSMGLHREPDYFPEEHPDPKLNNLQRKIWYGILILDANDFILTGSPLITHPESFDTKTPYYVPGNENIRDIEVEKMTDSQFSRFDSNFQMIYEASTLITSLKKKVNLYEFSLKMNDMEKHLKTTYGDSLVSHLGCGSLSREMVFAKSVNLKIFFSSIFFLSGIYLHLFNYYEAKVNYTYAFYYMKKMMIILIPNLLPFYSDLVENSSFIFKSSTDLFVTPSFELVLHKTCIAIQSLYMRCRFSLKDFESSPDHIHLMKTDTAYSGHINAIETLTKNLLICTSALMEITSVLSKRYYYSWRMLKACTFILKILKDDDIYNHIGKEQSLLRFTTPMVNELNGILKQSIKKIEEQKRKLKTSNLSYNSNISNTVDSLDVQMNRSSMSNESLSVGSTNSASIDYDFFGKSSSINHNNDPQVDDLWIQMISVKENPFNPLTNGTSGDQIPLNLDQPFPVDIENGVPLGVNDDYFDRLAFDDFFPER